MQLQMSCNKVKISGILPEWMRSLPNYHLIPSRCRPLAKPALDGSGWRTARGEPSLADMFASVRTAKQGPFWRKLLAFLGPGYLVAVGYMDPGNWATSLAGGSKFGYALLTVALLSNLMAIVLQSLCTRLGVGAGRDLAQACRDSYPRWVSLAAVAVGGNRHHRDRSRRSDRHRDRPQPAVSYSARDRRHHHRRSTCS